MSKKTQIWERLSSRLIFDQRIKILEYRVALPTGEESTYLVEHGDKGAVATLISPKGGYVILTYQYRFPLDRWIYDLPGGSVKRDENAKEAAIRECKEELGITPKKLIHLTTFYTNPARVDWPMNIFFASGFENYLNVKKESDEIVEKLLTSVKKLEALIKNKKIVDPSVIIAFTCARIRGLI